MKKLLLAACLLASVPALAQTMPIQQEQAGSIDALDTKNGFRDYRLGSNISDYPNLKPKGKDKYVARDESLLIGNVKLSSLTFNSYKGKLISVSFGTIGIKEVDNLFSILVAQYGPGQEAGFRLQAWKGQVATMLFQGGGGGQFPFAVVLISSNELTAQQEQEALKSNKKAAGDL